MTFDVNITAETGRAYVPFLSRHVRAARELLEASSRRSALGEMSLALVGDAKMSQLHHEFMGINTPTDVLTFPMDQTPGGRVTSGEVIVCVPEARRQARMRTIPVRLELLLYSIHGMLHLLGYDDRTARDFHAMHRTEDEIMTRLGFGPVFHSAGRTRSDSGRSPIRTRRRRVTDKSVRHTGAQAVRPGRRPR